MSEEREDRIPNSARPKDLIRAVRAAGFERLRGAGDHEIYGHRSGVKAVIPVSLRYSPRSWKNVVSSIRRALAKAAAWEKENPC